MRISEVTRPRQWSFSADRTDEVSIQHVACSQLGVFCAFGWHVNSVEGPVVGAMDTMIVPTQCNIDNRALFKSLEAYHQLAQLATAKHPNFLSCVQKIHNQKAEVKEMDHLHNLLRPGLSSVSAMR
ncbi:hypothetical protein DPMN_119708 [Dreissena polymorpha]|uniref:Uncharacterized protein n=1 Tax=Dreissena polymorpha TaxID=45954 RepID=A0A9D4GJQ5_DREPO|nr:hypothetical protein DPMN_119708 [Dreissena polymorpha]